MATFYIVCAVLGGTVLLCQLVMTLLGMWGETPDHFGDHVGGDHFGGDHFGDHGGDHVSGDGHDHHQGHGSSWFFGVLSFRTFIAAMCFFGLAGMAGTSGQMANGVTLAIAIVAGLAAMYAVHWMMLGLHSLRAEGTVKIRGAVGKTGTVYLNIPGHKSGAGKVTLSLQNRTMEYQAMTSQDEIPTGAKVVVLNVLSPDTVEVEVAPGAASES